MTPPRKIDERDVDQLLAALTDRQIADLFDLPEQDVMELRQSRKNVPSKARAEQKPNGKSKT